MDDYSGYFLFFVVTFFAPLFFLLCWNCYCCCDVGACVIVWFSAIYYYHYVYECVYVKWRVKPNQYTNIFTFAYISSIKCAFNLFVLICAFYVCVCVCHRLKLNCETAFVECNTSMNKRILQRRYFAYFLQCAHSKYKIVNSQLMLYVSQTSFCIYARPIFAVTFQF